MSSTPCDGALHDSMSGGTRRSRRSLRTAGLRSSFLYERSNVKIKSSVSQMKDDPRKIGQSHKGKTHSIVSWGTSDCTLSKTPGFSNSGSVGSIHMSQAKRTVTAWTVPMWTLMFSRLLGITGPNQHGGLFSGDAKISGLPSTGCHRTVILRSQAKGGAGQQQNQ